jgi:hypothetical protein
MNYTEFLERKSQCGGDNGFDPIWMPEFLFPFQRALTSWSLKKGRSAIFADCGLGKTPMQLVWAENVARKTNKPVLIATPLAVSQQTINEASKFGIEATRSQDGTVHRITVTNYERLEHFEPSDFGAMVCDESSILKHFGGTTQKRVTRFMSKMPYRLLCTATAAPNDYPELGTSAEALGEIGYSDMLSRWFKQDDKKKYRMNEVKLARGGRSGNHYARLAYRVSQQIGQWHLKAHAETPFFKWVCSWARACRWPSDLGFDDGKFRLPPLIERHHVVTPKTPQDGALFTLAAFGLKEERAERRRTLAERCGLVADLVNHNKAALVWCHLNVEGDTLERLIPGSVQVAGSDTDEKKENALMDFAAGNIRVLITKPRIAGFGLNFQHCGHVVTFASHSYEQYYQSIRRCWRFGRHNDVTVDVVSTEGEQHVRDNMIRKAEASSVMFDNLVRLMNESMRASRSAYNNEVEVPAWL